MEKHSVTTRWLGNQAFESDILGHKIVVDVAKEAGGDGLGPGPKRLMLVALAGCTGIDVVRILRKMRVDIKDLRITVEADMTDEHPRHYISMNVIYEFTGRDLPVDKLQKAVDLSEEKYCGVRAAYSKSMKMSSSVKVINE